MMINFHAVLIGEDGYEFGADFAAANHNAAWQHARENYPESSVVNIEAPQDALAREQRTYARMEAMWDNPDLDDYGY